MADGNYTVTTAANLIPTILGAGVLRARKFNMVMQESVNTNWAGGFLGYGSVYEMPRMGHGEVETKSASSPLTARTYTDTKQGLTVNVHQGIAHKIEDIANLLSKPDLQKERSQDMGYVLGRAVDVNLFALIASVSQNVGALGTELSFDNLLTAVKYLAAVGVDMNDDVTWMFYTDQYYSLLNIDQFSNALYAGDKNAMDANINGKVGRFLGAGVKTSQLVTSNGAGHDNALFQKSLFALMIAARPKVETERFAIDVATLLVASQIYGYTEVDIYDEAGGNITAVDKNGVWLKGK